MSNFSFQNINIADLIQKAKNFKIHTCCILTGGIIMSLLGIFSMFHPGRAILSLAVFIGFGFVIAGISHIFALFAYKNGSVDHPCWFMTQGVFEIVLGFILLANIGVTALSIPVMVAFWVLIDGIMRMTTSFQLKKANIGNWWHLLLYGLISMFFALILLTRPFAGIIAVTFLLGVTLLAWGITAIFEAINIYD